ncbi:MAG TPA: TRAP transporter small permease [Spirochaetales bacterium]|nr:TRAP transporter small permease [Spirochaetales bacterium]
MRTIQRLLDFLFNVTEIITNICMVLLFLVVNIGIFSRYIFLSPFAWTEELALFLLTWMVFLAGSKLIRKWENIRVTYFLEKLPIKLANYIEFITKILVLVFLVYAMVLAINVIPKVGPTEKAPALGIPMTIPQMGLVVGLVLMFIQMIGVCIEVGVGFFKKKEEGK